MTTEWCAVEDTVCRHFQLHGQVGEAQVRVRPGAKMRIKGGSLIMRGQGKKLQVKAEGEGSIKVKP